MSATTVVSIRDAGRWGVGDDVYIGRPSPYGNPFTVREHGRVLALDLYRVWVAHRVANEPQFRASVAFLRGKRLGCFCKPLPCHGDILAEIAETL